MVQCHRGGPAPPLTIRPLHPPGSRVLHLEEHSACQSPGVLVGVSQQLLLAALRGGGEAFAKNSLAGSGVIIIITKIHGGASSERSPVMISFFDAVICQLLHFEQLFRQITGIVTGLGRVNKRSLFLANFATRPLGPYFTGRAPLPFLLLLLFDPLVLVCNFTHGFGRLSLPSPVMISVTDLAFSPSFVLQSLHNLASRPFLSLLGLALSRIILCLLQLTT